MSLGVAYQALERLRLEGNYVRFGWSAFEKLALDFNTDALDQSIYFGYEDSWQVRFGGEYWASDNVSLMAGYVHDKTPQPLISVNPAAAGQRPQRLLVRRALPARQLGPQRQLHGGRGRRANEHRGRRAAAATTPPTTRSVPTNHWPTCSGSAFPSRRCRQ